MANPTIDALVAQVQADDGVIDSAVIFINGSQARMDAAVQAALAGGATAADLKPITDEIALQKSKAQVLADAIVANTPAAPTP